MALGTLCEEELRFVKIFFENIEKARIFVYNIEIGEDIFLI